MAGAIAACHTEGGNSDKLQITLVLVFVFIINIVFVKCIAVHCSAMKAGGTGETLINYRSDLCLYLYS